MPDPLERVRPTALRAAALALLAAKPEPVVDTEHIAPVRASVARRGRVAAAPAPRVGADELPALVAGVETRLEVVVRFLAVLELYKQGMVDLLQFTNFGELLVRRLRDGETASTPSSLDDWDDEPVVDRAPEPVHEGAS